MVVQLNWQARQGVHFSEEQTGGYGNSGGTAGNHSSGGVSVDMTSISHTCIYWIVKNKQANFEWNLEETQYDIDTISNQEEGVLVRWDQRWTFQPKRKSGKLTQHITFMNSSACGWGDSALFQQEIWSWSC